MLLGVLGRAQSECHHWRSPTARLRGSPSKVDGMARPILEACPPGEGVPRGSFTQVRNFPSGFTGRQLKLALQADYPRVFARNLRICVSSISGQEALEPPYFKYMGRDESALSSLGASDGGVAYLEVVLVSTGIASDTIEFIIATAGAGVVGNAAYDALKAGVISLAREWHDGSSLRGIKPAMWQGWRQE